MDRKLLDILCCPTSKQPLALLGAPELAALNRAIAAGAVVRPRALSIAGGRLTEAAFYQTARWYCALIQRKRPSALRPETKIALTVFKAGQRCSIRKLILPSWNMRRMKQECVLSTHRDHRMM